MALNRKLSRDFESWCKFSNHVKAKSHPKKIYHVERDLPVHPQTYFNHQVVMFEGKIFTIMSHNDIG